MEKGMKTESEVKIKFSWDRESKRLVACVAGMLLLGILVCGVAVDRYCAVLNQRFNLAAASMLGSVKEAYPEASEEELIAVLSSDTDDGRGEALLGKYGILLREAESSFAGIRKREGRFLALLAAVGVLTACGVFLILFLWLAHRQRETGQLCSYVDEVSRGDFRLDMSDNRNSEFSRLKNELYKLTVIMREQAKTAIDNRKALADAVADISHQLKTPLTSVTVLVDNLLEDPHMEPAVRSRFLREISSQLSGVSWMTATLLKLSRLDAGVVELERKPLYIKALAEKVCRKLELLAEWRQVGLKLQIPDDIQILGDEQWLTEALVNLVKNALEHSEPETEVLLAAQENDVYTLVTVRDQGEGISEEEQRHLFERFYRGRSAGADNVGIGLALSREIIVRQGGYITVESERGKGTVFFIKFIKCH